MSHSIYCPPIHWTLAASAEPCSEERYEEQLEILPPAWLRGDRFAVGEISTYTAGGLPIYPVCFIIDGQHYWGTLPIRPLKQLSNEALLRIARGSFVARDGGDRGFVIQDGELAGRFCGELASIDGLCMTAKTEGDTVSLSQLRKIIESKFDIAYWGTWDDGEWGLVSDDVDIV